MGGRTSLCTLNNLASMVHALLTATLAKLWGSKKADACAACMDSTILSHSDWANHKHCNLEPDLDATSLSLLCSGVKVSLPAALARSWVTRLLANYDGGLAEPARDPGGFSPAGLAGSLIFPRSPWTLLARKCGSSNGPHIAVATSW